MLSHLDAHKHEPLLKIKILYLIKSKFIFRFILPFTFSSASTDCLVPKAVRSVTVRAEKTSNGCTLKSTELYF